MSRGQVAAKVAANKEKHPELLPEQEMPVAYGRGILP
jgi:hypothetical protein